MNKDRNPALYLFTAILYAYTVMHRNRMVKPEMDYCCIEVLSISWAMCLIVRYTVTPTTRHY